MVDRFFRWLCIEHIITRKLKISLFLQIKRPNVFEIDH